MTNVVWHYLPIRMLEKAVSTGKLQIPLLMKESDEKHPAIWFTSQALEAINPSMLKHQGYLHIWDRSNPREVKLGKVVRIGIDYNTYFLSWKEHCLISLDDQRKARKQAEELFCSQETDQWFASYHEIPLDEWVKAEVLEEGIWKEYTLNQTSDITS